MSTGVVFAYKGTAERISGNGQEEVVYMENFDNDRNIFENCEIIDSAAILNNTTFSNCYMFINSGEGLRSGPFLMGCNFAGNTIISFSNPSSYLENCTGTFMRRLDNGTLSALDASAY